MKVKANCTINHNGVWHHAGNEFEISGADAMTLGSAVTVISRDAVQDDFDIHAPLYSEAVETPKRGRKRKADGMKALEIE